MVKVKKERADVLLHRLGMCESREQAKRLILAGAVRTSADHVVKKASEMVAADADFIIKQNSPYVSRGAYKLLPALEKYLPDLNQLSGLDVGASTGGFTDLMLQKGARKVYTVDSGTGQLHFKLREDPRVVCHEKVNARYLEEDFLPELVQVITMDVSFISVTKILPAVNKLLKKDGLAFILVKPQFEAGREFVERGGVVKSEKVRQECVEKVVEFAEAECSWKVLEVIASPIKGPKGNQEYMCVFKK